MKKNFLFGALVAALFLPFASCGSDDDDNTTTGTTPTLTETSYEMYARQQTALKGANLDGLTWTSGNEFVALVDGSDILSTYVGNTTITSGNLSFTVNVEPRYTYYTEPINDFGKTAAELKAAHGNPAQEMTEDGYSMYLYTTGNNDAPAVLYVFDNGHVAASAVWVKLTGEQLVDFLSERYQTIEADEDDISYAHMYGTFEDPHCDMVVAQEYDDDNSWTVGYALASTVSKAAINPYLEAAKKALKTVK